MRVLVLGGYGTFGGRLIRLLADEPRLTLICAGRTIAKAKAFIAESKTKATLLPAQVDRNGDLGVALSEWQPNLVVDATGPFQVYGDAPYRVVEAAIAAGVDYVDLADGTDFVVGITRFDAAARARDVTVISGASTFPALSFAVVRDLTQGWQRIDGIEMGLSPSPKAGLGRNVIEAILSYAGKPTPYMQNGEVKSAPALVDSRRHVIAPPGIEPLPPLRFSLIDLPDQTLMPEEFSGLHRLWPGVATRPQILLRGLNLCARFVQWRAVRSLSPVAGLGFWAINRMAYGVHRGGMFLKIDGTDEAGKARRREWHMMAEGDDGPIIPVIAVATLIRRQLEGEKIPAGARPATEDFSLGDYEQIFVAKQITARVRDTPREGASLYERVLNSAWAEVPEAVRALHTDTDGRMVRGRAQVDRGRNPLARLVAAIVGFPKASEDVAVEVQFTHRNGGELWQRSFDGRSFETFQKEGTRAFEHLLSERFGPLEFGLALILKDEKLWLKTIAWRAFGIPMPRFLAPSGDAYEHVVDGRFHFYVEIKHWLTGLIVRYRGWLELG